MLLHQEFQIGTPGDPVVVKIKLSWILMSGKQQLVNKWPYNYLSKDKNSEILEILWQIDTYGTLPKFNPSSRTKESFPHIRM